MSEDKNLHMSIEPRHGVWNVYQWYLKGSGSVLSGTEQKRWIDDYETKGEAEKAFPDAEVYLSFCPADQVSPHAPAGYYGGDGGFYDAGEYWSEEDY